MQPIARFSLEENLNSSRGKLTRETRSNSAAASIQIFLKAFASRRFIATWNCPGFLAVSLGRSQGQPAGQEKIPLVAEIT